MRQESLFGDDAGDTRSAQADQGYQPLASRLRPQTLAEFVGQENLVAPGQVLYNLIERDEVSSMIFWGPPGVGKTTLAQLIARQTKAAFVTFSAVTSGIKEIRKVMEEAEGNRELGQKKPSSSWMKFTDLIRPNRTRFCRTLNAAASF